MPAQAQQSDSFLKQLANNERLFTYRWFTHWAMICAGSLVMAAGYVYFIVPYKIVPGGVYGIGIMLYYLFHVPTGMSGLVLNVPLIIIGMRVLGPRFGIKTIIGMVLTSGLIDLLTYYWGNKPLVDDPLLSAGFGGVLIGVGLGLIFRAKATTGGTDIVAQVFNKYTRIPVGQLLMITDACIVGLAIIAFHDIKLALYALITIYVTGRVLDAMLTGLSYEKAVYIISDKYTEIRDVIINKLDRGGTFLLGHGMFKGHEKQVIFTAVSRRDYVILQEHVRQIDPRAFMTVVDANEIIGEGFKPIEET
jgi:uncharacterized membrane-anchored protein YitT (DUF2179 family)